MTHSPCHRFARSHRRTWLAWVRVGLFALSVAAGLGALAVRVSVAHAKDAMLQLGRSVTAMIEHDPREGERIVVLNGQPLHLAVTTLDRDVVTVLDHYDAWCHAPHGRFADLPARIAAATTSPAAAGAGWLDLTLRERHGGEGFVGCLVTDDAALDPEAQIAQLARTGDPSALGALRYVYVTPVGDDGDDITRGALGGTATTTQAPRSLVVSIWTDGPLRIDRMLPLEGDAPGRDVPGIPRPPTGRRMISGDELGIDASITVYAGGTDDLDTLAAFYDRAFDREGWRVLARERTSPVAFTYIVERAAQTYAIGLRVGDNGHSTVAIAGAAPATDKELP